MCCLSFLDLQLLITPLVSSNIWPLHLCVRRFTDSDYPFGIFKHLTIAFFVLPRFTLLITPLISSNIRPLYLSVLRFTDFDYFYGIFKCLTIVLSVLRQFTDLDFALGIFKIVAIALSVLRFAASDVLFDTFKLLFFDILILVTPLVSLNSSYNYISFHRFLMFYLKHLVLCKLYKMRTFGH